MKESYLLFRMKTMLNQWLSLQVLELYLNHRHATFRVTVYAVTWTIIASQPWFCQEVIMHHVSMHRASLRSARSQEPQHVFAYRHHYIHCTINPCTFTAGNGSQRNWC